MRLSRRLTIPDEFSVSYSTEPAGTPLTVWGIGDYLLGEFGEFLSTVAAALPLTQRSDYLRPG